MEDTSLHGKLGDVIVVTGSSGLIGSQVIKRMSQKYSMIGLDRDGPPYPPVEAECIPMDLTSEESVKRAFERIRYGYGNRLAAVIHLAAYYSFSEKSSDLYEEITIKGTERLLNVLKTFQVGVFLFSSTNLIYKPTVPGKKIHEDCPVEPNWDYPESKADTEKVIFSLRGDMKSVILRIAGVYDNFCHSIPISHQIQRIYEKQFTSHFYSGDIHHGNVFVHLDDVTDAIEKTVEKRTELPGLIAINIGEPYTPTYDELQKEIGKLVHGEDWETYEIAKPIAKIGSWTMDLFGNPFIKPWMIDRADDHYELDISRAKQLLDWSPRHTVLQTLPKMIDNLKNNPEAWYKENKLDGKQEKQEGK